jgi:3-deoxy-manno-octulosonate cytidylyltransferase (CMP-KDO synthetase)
MPGKPLMQIGGRTMLERVIAVARQAADLVGNCEVVAATDDDRIAAHAQALGVEAVMTSRECDSGSSRAFAAAAERSERPELVVNLQGDAPFVPPAVLAGLVAALRRGGADVATPVFQLDWARLDRLRAHKLAAPFSGTTCIRDARGQAVWFSKAILPAIRSEEELRMSVPKSPVWQHLGLYGYRMAALEWFAAAPQGTYEVLEGLEQLRFLEAGRTIATVEVDPPSHAMSGIDTPADLAMAEEAIARLGDPFPG